MQSLQSCSAAAKLGSIELKQKTHAQAPSYKLQKEGIVVVLTDLRDNSNRSIPSPLNKSSQTETRLILPQLM